MLHGRLSLFVLTEDKGRAFFLYDQILFLQMWEGKRGTDDGQPVSKRKSPAFHAERRQGEGYYRSDEMLCYIRSKIVLKMALQIPKSTTPTVQMAKANFVLPSLWKVGSGWSLLRMYIALTIFR